MPSPPQDAQQRCETHSSCGQEAPRPAAARSGAASADQRSHAHAGGRLQHASGSQAAGEQRSGGQTGGGQPGPATQPAESGPKKAGDNRIEAKREQRPQQPTRLQPSQRELHRGEYACVHQKVDAQKGFNGHLGTHLAFQELSYGKNCWVPRNYCR